MSFADNLPSVSASGDPIDYRSHLAMLPRNLRKFMTQLESRDPGPIFGTRVDAVPIWAEVARLDIRPALRSWFSPRERDWRWYPAKSGHLGERPKRGCLGLGRPRGGGRGVGIAWTYDGVHDIDGTFNGLPRTQNDVVVRGFTIVGIEDSKLQFWRYIDWIDLYTQLGMTINWRVPVDYPAAPEPEPEPES